MTTTGFELILPFLRPIQHLILDPEISEIMVNGPEHVFIERAGRVEAVLGLTLSPKSLEVAVRNIARRLGDDISEEKPVLDSRLPDGSRVAAVVPPCSLHGVTLTIRKFNAKHFGMQDLIRIGTITEELAGILETAVINRQNILISGGTGTGKTTLLNILATLIPEHERILIIEDTAEIQISAPNLVRFEARIAQTGFSAVTIRELLKASLRHRPDRILLGEIRGAEAFDLLQLLNTGHSGTISTVHANSALQAVNRFTSCVLQSNVELPYRAIKSNIADSLNLLVQVERRPGLRFVSEVLEIAGYSPDSDRYDLKRVFVREEGNETAVLEPSSSLGADHNVTLSSLVLSGRNHALGFASPLPCDLFDTAFGHDARSRSSIGAGTGTSKKCRHRRRIALRRRILVSFDPNRSRRVRWSLTPQFECPKLPSRSGPNRICAQRPATSLGNDRQPILFTLGSTAN